MMLPDSHRGFWYNHFPQSQVSTYINTYPCGQGLWVDYTVKSPFHSQCVSHAVTHLKAAWGCLWLKKKKEDRNSQWSLRPLLCMCKQAGVSAHLNKTGSCQAKSNDVNGYGDNQLKIEPKERRQSLHTV